MIELIKIYVTGDGFLYNMVRIIVGTLIEVGRGRINQMKLKNIIASKNREKAGIMRTCQGIILKRSLLLKIN